MSEVITIKNEDILDQVKLSCQIPKIIEGIVTRQIIATAVAEAGIKVETEELQKAADAMRSRKQLWSPDETQAWLEKYGLSLDDFEELVYLSLSSSKLAQHLFGDQVESYFFAHQLDYAGVLMYEVILDDEELAMELFYSISEGEISFSEVARQYIQDSELSRRGGYRGVVRRQEMKPEISAAVFMIKSYGHP
jgi:parvulin-like peptidyl-prolyl isomerase